MKKVLIVLALVALAVLPVAAKKGIEAVGVELGQPTGITILFPIENKKLDGYFTGSFGFGSQKYIDFIVGGQYEVTTFKIEKAKFGVNAGIQTGGTILLGENAKFGVPIRLTGSIDWDFKLKDIGDFTAYIRAGLGCRIDISKEGIDPEFSFCAVAGLVYHL